MFPLPTQRKRKCLITSNLMKTHFWRWRSKQCTISKILKLKKLILLLPKKNHPRVKPCPLTTQHLHNSDRKSRHLSTRCLKSGFPRRKLIPQLNKVIPLKKLNSLRSSSVTDPKRTNKSKRREESLPTVQLRQNLSSRGASERNQ